MAAEIFIIFPENIPDDEKTLIDDLKNHISIVKNINDYKNINQQKTVDLFFDVENMKTYMKNVKIILESEMALYRKQYHGLFKTIKNWRNKPLPSNENSYGLWDLQNWIMHTDIKPSITELVKRKMQYSQKDYSLLNFNSDHIYEGNPVYMSKNHLSILIDGPAIDSFPVLFNIRRFRNGDILNWIDDLEDEGSLNLKNHTDFTKTNLLWNKQSIYKQISTGHYWYYDYYHRDNKEHYEVFDHTGKHLGEANLNFELDESKIDSDKSISKLLSGK